MTRRLAAAVALALSWGCVLPALPRKHTGRPLGEDRAARILPGKTTKAELFESLGAPMAIAARGEYVQVPATSVHHVDPFGKHGRWYGGGSYVQQADAWLELFAARRPLRETERVYYWYATGDGGIVVWVLVGVEAHHASTDELWVLVDEATGLVDDVFFLST